jgi:hypothetical protein
LDFFVINLNISKIHNLDDKGGSFLQRGTDLHQKGIKEFHPFSLFGSQRHDNKGKQQKEGDENKKAIPSGEEKITYPHQSQY